MLCGFPQNEQIISGIFNSFFVLLAKSLCLSANQFFKKFFFFFAKILCFALQFLKEFCGLCPHSAYRRVASGRDTPARVTRDALDGCTLYCF